MNMAVIINFLRALCALASRENEQLASLLTDKLINAIKDIDNDLHQQVGDLQGQISDLLLRLVRASRISFDIGVKVDHNLFCPAEYIPYRKIPLIQCVRAASCIGLRDAKELVELCYDSNEKKEGANIVLLKGVSFQQMLDFIATAEEKSLTPYIEVNY